MNDKKIFDNVLDFPSLQTRKKDWVEKLPRGALLYFLIGFVMGFICFR
jgi:hypothetical protein